MGGKKTCPVLVAAGFHHVKLSSKVCVKFHWLENAAQQQTRRPTESRWGPSGELNVSCCAKLQNNNSSSHCPQRKTESRGKQQQHCQRGSQCLIIMLRAWDRRFTTCSFIVYMLEFGCYGLSGTLTFFMSKLSSFYFVLSHIINLPAVKTGSISEAEWAKCISDWLADVM